MTETMAPDPVKDESETYTRSVLSLNPDAEATDLFTEFLKAESCSKILSTFPILLDRVREIHDESANSTLPYSLLKGCVNTSKGRELWPLLDARASQSVYMGGQACRNTKVMIIGAGPCGLRFAVEAALLGAKVVVIEKRTEFTRNNVLHLWPYVITDLKAIGTKILYPRFCVGGINHISIRSLQRVLLKICLLLGVEIHTDTTFNSLLEPTGPTDGWRVSVNPEHSPVSEVQFDVLIGADGRRNNLPGFQRREFRGKLAIAITFNFVNNKTREEARVREVGGIASYNFQKLFKELKDERGIDLENFVYYKGDTHYVVMTAKKESLLKNEVLIHDFSNSLELLAKENIYEEKLLDYARNATSFVAKLPKMEFVVNHRGKPDIAMFDFTSMFAARNSCCIKERHGKTLLMALVGDSLLEPFWPLGTGCARGFLGAFDTAWMMRGYAQGEKSILELLSGRENLYQLLPQTSPSTLHKQFSTYSIDPASRYKSSYSSSQLVSERLVEHLYDSDTKENLMKR